MISVVISCESAMISESAVLMMAAKDAVMAMTPAASANPPRLMISSKMAEKGLDGSATSPLSLTNMITPTVPKKTPTNEVNQGPMAMTAYPAFNDRRSLAAYVLCAVVIFHFSRMIQNETKYIMGKTNVSGVRILSVFKTCTSYFLSCGNVPVLDGEG